MTAIASGTYHEPMLFRAVHAGISSFFSIVATPPLRRADLARRRIVEANRVRAMAANLEREQPGFAADLYAAASRHEMGD